MGTNPDHALWAQIEHYYMDLIVKPDPRFNEILHKFHEIGLTPLWISSTLGSFLELMVCSLNAKRALEIGAQGGYSTTWLAKGLPDDGILISIEIQPENATLAAQNASRFELSDKIQFLVGDALGILEDMIYNGVPPFDFIFIDAEKSQYSEYLELCIQLSRTGTVIIADNVVKHGHFVNETIQTPSQIGITAFHQKVAADPRIKATVLQTVDAKGHDGFTYMVVNPQVV